MKKSQIAIICDVHLIFFLLYESASVKPKLCVQYINGCLTHVKSWLYCYIYCVIYLKQKTD